MPNAIWVGLVLAASVACVKNVPQDLKTGEDGRNKGAKEMKIENDEAKAHGIVTYPGGDRVDWKVLELPKDQTGTVELKLRWTPPRPGLDLSFDVYNEYGRLLESAKPNTRARSRKTQKVVTVPKAKGKLFIEVYASGRGDAGKYTLTAGWKADVIDTGLDWLAVQLMDPPKLPAVPEPIKPCEPFDKANPACKNECPITAYDPTWPPCANVCPVPPDPKIKACKLCNKDQMDPCLPDCLQYYPACDPDKVDPTNPKCDGVTKQPQAGEITDIKSLADGTQVTINLGTENGIDKTNWVGDILDPAGAKLTGTFKLVSVGKRASVGKTTNSSVPQGSTIVIKPKPGPAIKACH
ncbi:MAG: hypothetical protein JNK64_30445 [Myxococcales bacterium]|nr:hypothetical protein [Myxococcales bacterium]